MKKFIPSTLSLCFVFVLSVHAQINPDLIGTAKVGYESIKARDLQAHLKFLASDELEGRETSFRGQKVAALYIESTFQQLGLKPVGDSGTYFQHFNVDALTPGENSYLAVKTDAEEKKFTGFLTEFIPTIRTSDTSITAPVVFVGYGITAQDFHYDDYAGINVKGKIAMMFAGEPPENDSISIFGGKKPSWFGSRLAKIQTAHNNGVAGIILIVDLKTQAEAMIDSLQKGVIRLYGAGPSTRSRRTISVPTFYVSRQAANEILRSSKKNVEELQQEIDHNRLPSSLEVNNTTATMAWRLRHQIKQTENVVGFLEGSDPNLKEEVLLFTAHYDHLGMSLRTGEIFHGADDDGSGTATVLEIAKAFVTNPMKPKRSILFMTVAGEEKGLLGSSYYVEHPVLPLEKTVADLNIDMVGRVDPKYETLNDPNYIYLIGSDKLSTELHRLSEQANKESVNLMLDYTYNDERDPNRFYERSDHYNFVKKNIPIIFYFNGTHKDYHRPTDTVDKIDFQKMEKIGKLIFYTGWKVANADHRPLVDKASLPSSH